MDIHERKREIVENLNQHNGIASMNYLCKRLYASRSTIRRDLISLEEDGIIKRAHGYVSLIVKSAKESPINMRQIENLDKKQSVARKTDSLIKDGMVLFLDSSSTVCQLAPILKTKQNITVITNGINIANELSHAQNLTCFLCPGVLKHQSLSIVGEFTSAFIKNFHAELAILSCKAIQEKGVFEGDDSQGLVKKSMMENADKTILLCDTTKENAVGFFKTSDFDKLSCLISDASFSPSLQKILEEKIPKLY
ncbi:DeoR/GlpR family DNA-binding transcription regulator [Oribacterium parvum]|jgi:transcription regulator|uniref:DeoR/GlpR family DNA-binding transcription regulator n=1 Tax=Oribacterium parvum TaxID=1501329 RepID=UPI0028E2691A|nr:DeoR/GlpR family DNA-binding transcription regulator [Oribacterium parvum]